MFKLNTPCRHLQFHYIRPGDGSVLFVVHHSDGSTTEVQANAPDSRPLITDLKSDVGIEAVEIKLEGAKRVFLHRVCCIKPDTGDPQTERTCINLEALPRAIHKQQEFSFDGATFTTVNRRQTLSLIHI